MFANIGKAGRVVQLQRALGTPRLRAFSVVQGNVQALSTEREFPDPEIPLRLVLLIVASRLPGTVLLAAALLGQHPADDARQPPVSGQSTHR